MANSVVVQLLLLGVTLSLAHRRHHSSVPTQLNRIQELIVESIKLLHDDVTVDENNRLETTANNFHIYDQEAVYFFNKAIEDLHDPETRKIFNVFIQQVADISYNLGQVLNSDSKHIKGGIKTALNKYKGLVSHARQLFEQPGKDQTAFVLNSARWAYDLVLYNFFLINTDIKYWSKTNKEIGSEIETNRNKAYDLLGKVKRGDPKILPELVAISQQLGHIFGRIIRKIERWANVFPSKAQKFETILGVSHNLSKIQGTLRKITGTHSTVDELVKGLETFFRDAAGPMKELDVAEGLPIKHEQATYKDILLEYLASVLAFNFKIEFLLKKTVP